MFRPLGPALVALALVASSMSAIAGETITNAMAKAYQNNSSLNSARAGVRVADEAVPLAKSGLRPRISGDATLDLRRRNGLDITTGSFGIQIDQVLFDGFQTKNNVAAAEASIRAARENLRNSTQNTLFDAASAFADVVRDRQIVALRAQNIAFLDEQLRAARLRFDVGEGTRTDVAQATALLAGAQAQLTAAKAQLVSSEAIYAQVVGEQPGKLNDPAPLKRGLPSSLSDALAMGSTGHPAIRANEALVDSRAFEVKSAEGKLLPSLSAQARVEKRYEGIGGLPVTTETDSASLTARLSVPIYQGGQVSAQVRQGKERLGQQRIEVVGAREQVRAAVTSAWAQYESAKASLEAGTQQVRAANLALGGLIEERKVGQRTTLDVLNGQSDVINAEIAVINAKRNVVVASYAVMSATGRLEPGVIGLGVREHDPKEHFDAVKDKWYGLRTPDGR